MAIERELGGFVQLAGLSEQLVRDGRGLCQRSSGLHLETGLVADCLDKAASIDCGGVGFVCEANESFVQGREVVVQDVFSSTSHQAEAPESISDLDALVLRPDVTLSEFDNVGMVDGVLGRNLIKKSTEVLGENPDGTGRTV